MSLGRSKSSAPAPTPSVPITNRFELNTPTGDQFVTEQLGGTQRVSSNLAPSSQRMVQQSQAQLNRMLEDFSTPSTERAQQVQEQADGLFSTLADSINDEADRQSSSIRSQNAVRFGGSLNSTFGNELLGRTERIRQQELGAARLQSQLSANDILSQDLRDQNQRIGLLNDLLSGVTRSSERFGSLGTDVLRNSQALAQRRSEAIDRVNSQNYRQRQQNRSNVFGRVVGGALGAFLF